MTMTTVETPIALKGNAEIRIEPSINIRPGERTPIFYVNSATTVEFKPRRGGWAFISLDPLGGIHEYFFDPDTEDNRSLNVIKDFAFVIFAHRRFGDVIMDYKTMREPLSLIPLENGTTPNGNPIPEDFLKIVEFLEDKRGKYA